VVDWTGQSLLQAWSGYDARFADYDYHKYHVVYNFDDDHHCSSVMSGSP